MSDSPKASSSAPSFAFVRPASQGIVLPDMGEYNHGSPFYRFLSFLYGWMTFILGGAFISFVNWCLVNYHTSIMPSLFWCYEATVAWLAVTGPFWTLVPFFIFASFVGLYYGIAAFYNAALGKAKSKWAEFVSPLTKAQKIAGAFLAAAVTTSIAAAVYIGARKAIRALKEKLSRDRLEYSVERASRHTTDLLLGLLDIVVVVIGSFATIGGIPLILNKVRFIGFLRPFFERLLVKGSDESSIMTKDMDTLHSVVQTWKSAWVSGIFTDTWSPVMNAIPSELRWFHVSATYFDEVIGPQTKFGSVLPKFMRHPDCHTAINSDSIWAAWFSENFNSSMTRDELATSMVNFYGLCCYTPKDLNSRHANTMQADFVGHKTQWLTLLVDSKSGVNTYWQLACRLVPGSIAVASLVFLISYYMIKFVRNIRKEETFGADDIDFAADDDSQSGRRRKHHDKAALAQKKALSDQAFTRAFGSDTRESADESTALPQLADFWPLLSKGLTIIRDMQKMEASGDEIVNPEILYQLSLECDGPSVEAKVAAAPRFIPYEPVKVSFGKYSGLGCVTTIASRRVVLTAAHNFGASPSIGDQATLDHPFFYGQFVVIAIVGDIAALTPVSTNQNFATAPILRLYSKDVKIGLSVVLDRGLSSSSTGQVEGVERGTAGDQYDSILATYDSLPGHSGSSVRAASEDENGALVGIHAHAGQINRNNGFYPLTPLVRSELDDQVKRFFDKSKKPAAAPEARKPNAKANVALRENTPSAPVSVATTSAPVEIDSPLASSVVLPSPGVTDHVFQFLRSFLESLPVEERSRFVSSAQRGAKSL